MKFIHAYNNGGPVVIPLYGVKGIEEKNMGIMYDGEFHDGSVVSVERYEGRIDLTPATEKSQYDAQIYISELMKMIKRAPEWSTIACYRGDDIDLFVEE
jgi:hypothetical protein